MTKPKSGPTNANDFKQPRVPQLAKGQGAIETVRVARPAPGGGGVGGQFECVGFDASDEMGLRGVQRRLQFFQLSIY